MSLVTSSLQAASNPLPSPSPALSPTESHMAAEQLLTVANTVLLQAIDILDQHLLSNSQLTVQSKYLPGSSIGKHLRHARDHFELLLDSITSPPPYIFSYDTRIRNTPMETDRVAARKALIDTISRLQQVVPTQNMDELMTLQAVTPYMQDFQTTFGRELWFACLHCIHHWSMVRVIAGELNIQLSSDFGFAPSTLVYRDKEMALSRM